MHGFNFKQKAAGGMYWQQRIYIYNNYMYIYILVPMLQQRSYQNQHKNQLNSS